MVFGMLHGSSREIFVMLYIIFFALISAMLMTCFVLGGCGESDELERCPLCGELGIECAGGGLRCPKCRLVWAH